MTDTAKAPAGVQGLINRLRDEGVKAGEEKAGKLLQEAQERATQLVAQAKVEAAEFLAKARSDIETERAAAHDSLRIAIRDTELKLGSELKAVFAAHVKRLVSMELEDKDFLKQVILFIAGTATGKEVCAGQPVEVLLPSRLFVSDEKGTRLNEQGKEKMRHFVLGISSEMLREGVELKPSDSISGGIRVRLVGEDLEIDLSDKALSELLLKNLLPRYRAIVSGAE